LIVDGKCVVHTGTSGGFAKGGGKGAPGKGNLVAYDLASGQEKWNWKGDGPGYGSPIVATIHGVKQVIEQTDENLIGVNLESGELLWKTPLKVGRYQTGTPIINGDTVVCVGAAFTIEKTGDKFEAKQAWKERAPATYNTPVLKDNVLYGLADAGGGGGFGKGGGGGKGGGKGGGMKSTTLYAQDVKSGSELWANKTPRGECGAILDAGKVMLMLTSDGNLVAFQPNKEEYKEVAKYKVADTPAFAMPVIAGKRIYVKDVDSVTLWLLE